MVQTWRFIASRSRGLTVELSCGPTAPVRRTVNYTVGKRGRDRRRRATRAVHTPARNGRPDSWSDWLAGNPVFDVDSTFWTARRADRVRAAWAKATAATQPEPNRAQGVGDYENDAGVEHEVSEDTCPYGAHGESTGRAARDPPFLGAKGNAALPQAANVANQVRWLCRASPRPTGDGAAKGPSSSCFYGPSLAPSAPRG